MFRCRHIPLLPHRPTGTGGYNKWVLCCLVLTGFCIMNPAFPHPTGNMITVGDSVLWSYIHPVDDPGHYACVMMWRPGSEPQVLIQSEYPASDYMLSASGATVYLIERRYLEARQAFTARIMKMVPGEQPELIWDWFEDAWRVGEGGFFMLSDESMVFGAYPHVYHLRKGGIPEVSFDFEAPVRRIRLIPDEGILLLGESECWLTDLKGGIINEWKALLDEQVSDPPLNRNQIFDADYREGELLLAYWGKRSFELVNNDGTRLTLDQQMAPMAPHWVAFYRNETLLFSSSLLFTGETPKPRLIRLDAAHQKHEVWLYRE